MHDDLTASNTNSYWVNNMSNSNTQSGADGGVIPRWALASFLSVCITVVGGILAQTALNARMLSQLEHVSSMVSELRGFAATATTHGYRIDVLERRVDRFEERGRQ